MSGRIIFHLDMDQFFAAVEMLHQPELRGLPVAVGGSPAGRGVVVTASYEARRFGVRSGMPAGEALRLCPQIVFIRSSVSKYCDISNRIFKNLLQYTDRVEPVSVDEAYMDVTDTVWKDGGVQGLALKIKRGIVESEGLTATVGAGPNRLVAKIASGMHKPDGFTFIPAERVAEVFRDMPVGDLHGVGKSTQKVLENFGIRTAGQLAVFPVDILRRRMGKFGEELVRIACGEGSDKVLVPDERPDEKSMGHEHTFSQDISDPVLLLGRLHLLCEKVARRLRGARMAGRTVAIKIRYRGFETVLHGCKLKRFVQHEIDVYPVAEKLFHESYRRGEPVRLVGVHVAELISAAKLRQQELFMIAPEPDDLTHACDEIRDRYGERAIGFASGVFYSGGRPISNSRRTNYYSAFSRDSWLR